MKLSDKELREIAANPNDEGAPVCAELLTLRREVRKYRAVLRDIAWRLINPPAVETARERIEEALKPQRGGK